MPCRRVARSASSAQQPTSYQNPVSANSADPGTLNNNNAGSDYYVYSTGNLFPIQHSTDLVTWTSVGSALRQRPSWVVQNGDLPVVAERATGQRAVSGHGLTVVLLHVLHRLERAVLH